MCGIPSLSYVEFHMVLNGRIVVSMDHWSLPVWQTGRLNNIMGNVWQICWLWGWAAQPGFVTMIG